MPWMQAALQNIKNTSWILWLHQMCIRDSPASLPKPILNKLIDKAMNSSAWSDEDKAIYEEKKSNMNYLFNFLSKEAAAALAELAMADKDAIVSDKILSLIHI